MVASASRLLFVCSRLAASGALVAALVISAHAQPVTQPFTFSLVQHTIPLVTHGTLALGDVDNDGDLDVFLSGLSDEGEIVTGLYLYEGKELRDGVSTFVFEAAPMTRMAFASAAWGDYDGDGDLDLITSGSRTAERPYDLVSVLYRNDGGRLVPTDASLEGFHSGAAKWLDFDNDGDLDLMIGGEDAEGRSRSILYKNDGATFVDAEAGLPGLAYGSAAVGDADGDGDLDLALAGLGANGAYTNVFRNDGGSFTPFDAGLEPSLFGSLEFGDFDGDGDLDLLQGGGKLTSRILDGISYLYVLNGLGVTTRFELPGGLSGGVTWGDYDNDGDLDVFLMGGHAALGPRTAELFANEGGELSLKTYLIGVVFGDVGWGDIEGDGDLDLLTAGLPTAGLPLVNLYENRRQVITPPAAPSGLSTRVEGADVELDWHDGNGAATYNLRVGTRPGASDVVAPMAEPSTGRRLISGRGNADGAGSWHLQDLPRGTYYWSVQSLDHAFVASSFAAEQAFVVSTATSADQPGAPTPRATKIHPPSPNPSTGPVTLRYDLDEAAHVTAQIHDVLGRRVATLVDGDEHVPGTYVVTWNGKSAAGSPVSSGLYLCVFEAGEHRQSHSIILSR